MLASWASWVAMRLWSQLPTVSCHRQTPAVNSMHAALFATLLPSDRLHLPAVGGATAMGSGAGRAVAHMSDVRCLLNEGACGQQHGPSSDDCQAALQLIAGQ